MQGTSVGVLTPGGSAGEPLHVLSSLERRSAPWDSDPEAARDALSAAVSLVLQLLGREPDPAKSREHVLLSVLAERRLAAGQTAELGALMQGVFEPPIAEIGALPMNSFMKKTERRALAAALNSSLASPTFAMWRQGATLDVAEWVATRDGMTPIVIVSVAHLDDEERALVLGVLLEEVLSWVRTPAWFLGRLQTDADRSRVLDGLAAARGTDASVSDELVNTLQRLAPRWFVVRNAHVAVPPVLVQPRYAMSLMRGPMTRLSFAWPVRSVT